MKKHSLLAANNRWKMASNGWKMKNHTLFSENSALFATTNRWIMKKTTALKILAFSSLSMHHYPACFNELTNLNNECPYRFKDLIALFYRWVLK
jgi:hypothetical protein